MLDLSDFFIEGSLPAQPLLGAGYLIHGARSSGKTSFAFQAAVRCVRSGGRAVVLCREASLHAKMPQPLAPLAEGDEDALRRMEFVFLDAWPSVLRELVALSRSRASMPDLILIDDDELALEAGDGESAGGHGTAAALPVDTTAGGGGGGGRRPSPQANMVAQCLSFLVGLSDWLVRRSGQQFAFIVVSNSVSGASSSTVGPAIGTGGARGTGDRHHRRVGFYPHVPSPASPRGASGAVGLPFSAFPIVQIFIGASGSAQVTPIPADRAEAVRLSFSLYWEDGLRLAGAP